VERQAHRCLHRDDLTKVRALENRPDVALTIDEGSESGNAKSLQIRGQATLETIDGVR
jgi:hypothetical protein